MTNLKTLAWERLFRTRICFYVTTEYNNLRIIPDIFKQTPCNKKICNTSNVWFNHEDINAINFFMIRKENLSKIRVSHLVKQKLWHMDLYGSAATEQQIELLKRAWNLPYNILISPCHCTKLIGIENWK